MNDIYSVENVTVIWGGRIITGFSDDSVLKINRNEDTTFTKMGIQGEFAYAKNPNRSGTVVFSLFSSAAALGQLRADADSGTRRPLMVRDSTSGGGFIVSADNCMITKMPELSRGKEHGSTEVTMFVPVLRPME